MRVGRVARTHRGIFELASISLCAKLRCQKRTNPFFQTSQACGKERNINVVLANSLRNQVLNSRPQSYQGSATLAERNHKINTA